jgi:hypothetical protein
MILVMKIVKMELMIAIATSFPTEMIAEIKAPTFTNLVTYVIVSTET